MSDGNDRFEQRVQSLLQASAEELDGRTRSRLTQARHAALEAVGQRRTKVWFWALPASATMAAAVLAVMLSINSGQHSGMDGGDVQIAATTPVDEFEIVTAEDSLEFYRDVEFYAWLDTVLDDDSTAGGV